MSGFPSLHPSGFLERDEPCDGPRLYRSQLSRESGGPLLNELLSKYNPSSRVTDYKFLETIRDLKEFSRHWKNIPPQVKDEIVQLLKSSDNELAKELRVQESFTNELNNAKRTGNVKNFMNKMIENFGSDEDLKCVNESHQIWTLVIVAIVAVIISFLIFMAGGGSQ